MRAVPERHFKTLPCYLQSLVDSAYCSSLALARITIHRKLIPRGTVNSLGDNSYSFQSKTAEKRNQAIGVAFVVYWK